MPGDVTRKDFLRRSAAVALAAGGLYELVDTIAATPARAATAAALPREQHLLRNVRQLTENGVEFFVPPLHHQLVTAKLGTGHSKAALAEARHTLEQALSEIDHRFPATPAGLGLTVGWGLPYFRRYVPAQWKRHAPRDLAAKSPAILDARRFPSDPAATILEQNDVILQFRSDRLDHIAASSKLILDRTAGMLELTSIRKGFVGGAFDGGVGLPKQMALKAGIPAASMIPDAAPLFLGFTSSQRAALGPDLIANLETLPGLTDQWPGGYFREGTTMHVSHVYLDLENWYTNYSFTDRVWATFTPNLDAPAGTMTVPEGTPEIAGFKEIFVDVGIHGFTGHSAAMQPANRIAADTKSNYGTVYPKGTALMQRPDFDTLDSPFTWTSDVFRDRWSSHPSAGVHFVAYAPTTDIFNRTRLAMDGHYADGTVLPPDPTTPSRQFNAVLETTHRQNFLVPPRRHRSFPLSEL